MRSEGRGLESGALTNKSVYYILHSMKKAKQTAATFGAYIRSRREALRAGDRRYSVRQVAQRVGVEPSYLSKIERDLRSVDLPPPLIMVEVLAVELTNTADYERDFSWLYSSHHELLGTDSGSGTIDYEDTAAGGLTGGVIANTSNLTAVLKALQTQGKAKVHWPSTIRSLSTC